MTFNFQMVKGQLHRDDIMFCKNTLFNTMASGTEGTGYDHISHFCTLNHRH